MPNTWQFEDTDIVHLFTSHHFQHSFVHIYFKKRWRLEPKQSFNFLDRCH